MPSVTFQICDEHTGCVIKSFNTLKQCVEYLHSSKNIDFPCFVDELENGDVVDTCSATYLIENYKDIKKVPTSLFDC